MSIQPIEFPVNVSWIVTRQDPDQVSFAAPGGPEYGVNIFFQTAAGNNGVVFVENRRYPDVRAIHAAISRAAHLVDEIGRLASNSFPD